ncbi:hypothetical protein J8N69_11380 [Marinomonas profundi]|uniref:hypothetical protein n=1 Tax=Marinomonas profundi TaxID=2726122 RepID=UPI001B3A8701|nr:hypothetical protein [Marinomonas profundi]UDV02194.1 hypothetical protein J8N69_11380 [Marinomonas profundi]
MSQHQTNQPLAKGRVVYAADYYPTQERDAQGKPKMKARYAPLGRATLWPAEQQGEMPQVSIELDSLPIGSNGAIKMSVFWDNPNQNQQPAPQQQQHQQAPQPQSYGSWGNPPQR